VEEERGGEYQALAEKIREQGVPCEVFPEAKSLTQQFILAEKKGARWVIVPGESPKSPLRLRDLAVRKDREALSLEEALAIIKQGEDL
jgi:histidyl-tRNA synthetase